MKPKRWQNWANVVLGAWLAISPWILGFAEQRSAALTAWTLGASVVFFAAIGVYMDEAWEEAITVILGTLLLGAPWAFDFAGNRAAMANAVVSGVLIAAFAIWSMLQAMDISEIGEERPAARTRQASGTR
jgi:hypothetical protein